MKINYLAGNFCPEWFFYSGKQRLLSGSGGLDVPNLAGIFGDRAIAGEISGAGNIQNGLRCPHVWILIILFRAVAGFNVRSQISKMEITVAAVQQLVHNPAEESRFVRAEPVGAQTIHHATDKDRKSV